MKLTINKDVLLNGLRSVEKATAVKSIQPILSNVLIETIDSESILIRATDLDITIQVKVSAEVEEFGAITLQAKKLIEIVSKLPNNDINFSLNDNNIVTLKCKRSKFDIIGISSGDYPELIEYDTDEATQIEVKPLINAIKKTVYATAMYDNSNILSGIRCYLDDNKLELGATDGNRMAVIVADVESNNSFDVVLPTRTLVEFSKVFNGLDTVSMIIKHGQICFETDDMVIISRTLEGQFPKYNQLIPNNELVAKIDRDEFIKALERTSTMVNERTSILKLDIGDELKLTANTPDLGDAFDKIDVDFDSEIQIAFNYKYLIDSLKAMDSDLVRLEMKNSLSAAILKPDSDEDYTCLIMPVQLK